jgi:hypothetical protein
VYDTLEEYVLCGCTYFPVKEISAQLKKKSKKEERKKTNQYEKDYTVREDRKGWDLGWLCSETVQYCSEKILIIFKIFQVGSIIDTDYRYFGSHRLSSNLIGDNFPIIFYFERQRL